MSCRACNCKANSGPSTWAPHAGRLTALFLPLQLGSAQLAAITSVDKRNAFLQARPGRTLATLCTDGLCRVLAQQCLAKSLGALALACVCMLRASINRTLTSTRMLPPPGCVHHRTLACPPHPLQHMLTFAQHPYLLLADKALPFWSKVGSSCTSAGLRAPHRPRCMDHSRRSHATLAELWPAPAAVAGAARRCSVNRPRRGRLCLRAPASHHPSAAGGGCGADGPCSRAAAGGHVLCPRPSFGHSAAADADAPAATCAAQRPWVSHGCSVLTGASAVLLLCRRAAATRPRTRTTCRPTLTALR